MTTSAHHAADSVSSSTGDPRADNSPSLTPQESQGHGRTPRAPTSVTGPGFSFTRPVDGELMTFSSPETGEMVYIKGDGVGVAAGSRLECTSAAIFLEPTLGPMVARVICPLATAVQDAGNILGMRLALAAVYDVINTPFKYIKREALGLGPGDDGLLDVGTELLLLEQIALLAASAVVAYHPGWLAMAANELMNVVTIIVVSIDKSGRNLTGTLYRSLLNLYYVRGTNVAPPKYSALFQLIKFSDYLIGVDETTFDMEIEGSQRRSDALEALSVGNGTVSNLPANMRELAAKKAGERMVRHRGGSGEHFMMGLLHDIGKDEKLFPPPPGVFNFDPEIVYRLSGTQEEIEEHAKWAKELGERAAAWASQKRREEEKEGKEKAEREKEEREKEL